MAIEVNASTPVYGPGTYRYPPTGHELTVSMNAGADALVRMGWVQVSEESVSRQTADVQDPAGRVEAPLPAQRNESIDDSVA